MKKVLIFIILLSPLVYGRHYVYTGHYPILEEPYFFGHARAMDIGPDGNLYIASSNNRIKVFTKEGKFLKSYYLFDENKLWDKRLDIYTVPVIDIDSSKIVKFLQV